MSSTSRLGGARSVPPVHLAAVAFLAGGVGVGVASFLPSYLGGSSLASQADLATAHAVALAGFAVAAVVAVAAGRPSARRSSLALAGALGAGVAAIDLGLVVTDIGQAASGAGAGGGLVLAVVAWSLCAAGSALALRPVLGRVDRRPDAPRRPGRFGTVVVTVVALGVAGLFAPPWDRYVVDLTAVGRTTTLTAGNAFGHPAAMIAGSVLVMVAVVAVALVSGLLRQAKIAAALLAGAVVVLGGQIASALVQWRIPLSPAQLGLSPARARALGLQVQAGFTGVFYLFCIFVALLALLAVFRAVPGLLARAVTAPSRPAPFGAAPSGPPPFAPPPYGPQPYGAQPYGAQPYGAQTYGAQPYGAPSYRPLQQAPAAHLPPPPGVPATPPPGSTAAADTPAGRHRAAPYVSRWAAPGAEEPGGGSPETGAAPRRPRPTPHY